MITFYLLNCNTCKPRIQKYGPIPSKVRINNLGPRKVNSERSSLPNQKVQEDYKTETAAIPHQVIRPSPKRYRPTFIDTVVPERYPNPKIYESQHKSQNINDAPTVHIINGINTPHSRHEKNLQHSYITHDVKSNCEQRDVRGVPSSPMRRNNDDIFNKGYYNYTVPDIATGGFKELRGFQEYTDNIKEMIEIQDDRKRRFESGSKSCGFSEVITTPSSFRSHFNLNPVENEKNMPRHYHGCRMQPYKLLQRSDHLHNYRRHIQESNYNKEVASHQYCTPYTYASENKGADVNVYNETSYQIENSSPVTWHKKVNISNATGSQVEAWSIVPKGTPKTSVNNTPMDEFCEHYSLDYNSRESRKLIVHRKENDFCSVNQYHKLVCDTVNSSLTSLCQSPGVKNEVLSHGLKVPDQAKILKVLQEPDVEEVCDSASDSSEI